MHIKRLASNLIIILLILATIFSFTLVRDYLLGYRMQKALEEAVSNSNGLERELLTFIREKFLDRRGLIGSEIHKGRLSEYSLLETMGQLMEYAVLTKNNRLFETTWRVTRRYFLSPRGYLYWRINRRTLLQDDATSLIDSLRVASSLIEAYKTFKEESYLKDGIYVGENIIRFNSYDSYLVDYFDGRTNKTSENVALFYLDLEMVLNISEYIPRFRSFYESSKRILEGSGNRSYIFFPTSFNIPTARYSMPPKINMIEQVYIAMNIRDYKVIKPFIDFIDKELKENGRLYISYYPDTKSASTDESSGVYVSLALLFLKLKDRERAEVFLEKLNRFRSKDYGFGEHKDKDFYVFDQLNTLILLSGMDSML